MEIIEVRPAMTDHPSLRPSPTGGFDVAIHAVLEDFQADKRGLQRIGGFILATADNHLRQIPGLTIEDWTRPDDPGEPSAIPTS